MPEFTHFNHHGESRMVDVSDKAATQRRAIARGIVNMSEETLEMVYLQRMKKGDVLEVARLAGIMAAKKTADLIPLCHPLFISGVDIHFQRRSTGIEIEASVGTNGPTGVEMEALTAVSVAALTIYDMCKAVEKTMTISGICLIKKTGGKSGTFLREE